MYKRESKKQGKAQTGRRTMVKLTDLLSPIKEPTQNKSNDCISKQVIEQLVCFSFYQLFVIIFVS